MDKGGILKETCLNDLINYFSGAEKKLCVEMSFFRRFAMGFFKRRNEKREEELKRINLQLRIGRLAEKIVKERKREFEKKLNGDKDFSMDKELMLRRDAGDVLMALDALDSFKTVDGYWWEYGEYIEDMEDKYM